MSNLSVMDANYNLTSILSVDVVDSPVNWLLNFNNELGGVFFLSILIVLGIIIFITTKSSGVVESDSEALSFSGLICTVLGIFMLVLGFVEWLWLIPVFLVTAIALYLNFTARQF